MWTDNHQTIILSCMTLSDSLPSNQQSNNTAPALSSKADTNTDLHIVAWRRTSKEVLCKTHMLANAAASD